jgi:hypothetical protein
VYSYVQVRIELFVVSLTFVTKEQKAEFSHLSGSLIDFKSLDDRRLMVIIAANLVDQVSWMWHIGNLGTIYMLLSGGKFQIIVTEEIISLSVTTQQLLADSLYNPTVFDWNRRLAHCNS